MKAKDAARQINQAVADHDLQGRWDALMARVAAGQSKQEMTGDLNALQDALAEHVETHARQFMAHLLTSLGQQVRDKRTVKLVSLRAATVAADQAWRAFHARLAPLPARLVDPEGLRRTLEKDSPRIASMAWPAHPVPRRLP